jgi:hypothetical protein
MAATQYQLTVKEEGQERVFSAGEELRRVLIAIGCSQPMVFCRAFGVWSGSSKMVSGELA